MRSLLRRPFLVLGVLVGVVIVSGWLWPSIHADDATGVTRLAGTVWNYAIAPARLAGLLLGLNGFTTSTMIILALFAAYGAVFWLLDRGWLVLRRRLAPHAG